MLGHRCWCHWQLNSHSFVLGGYNCICCLLTFVQINTLPYILCSCKSQKRKDHCSIAVVATLHYNDGHWELQNVIGTKTMSQQRQLNSYSFVLGNAEDVSVFVERDQRHGQQCPGQTVWYHLQVWIWMFKENHKIGVKMVIGNSKILIGTKTRSQHRQLNSFSFVLGVTNAQDVSVFVEGSATWPPMPWSNCLRW